MDHNPIFEKKNKIKLGKIARHDTPVKIATSYPFSSFRLGKQILRWASVVNQQVLNTVPYCKTQKVS